MTLDPGAFHVDDDKFHGFVLNNQNPDQDPDTNLPGAGVTYAVGGMTTHWTCATPRHHPTLERSDVYSDEEWDRLYARARSSSTPTHEFDDSIRHNIVRDALQEEFTELPEGYGVQNLPLAVERRKDNPEFVHWTGTDTVLGPLADGDQDAEPFILRSSIAAPGWSRAADGSRVEYAEIQNLMEWQTIHVKANTYIVCCNAYLTPQVLYNSGIRPDAARALPHRAADVLLPDRSEAGPRRRAFEGPRFAERVRAPGAEPARSRPHPGGEPEPQVWIPVSEDRPWHCQIHRDAFHYGDVAPNVDSRLVVDLRWFGIVEPRPESRITFSDSTRTASACRSRPSSGSWTTRTGSKQHRMMADMLRAANALGGFLPGSEPQFVAPGLPIHITGTTRMGNEPRRQRGRQ